jgi:hypothetical protein
MMTTLFKRANIKGFWAVEVAPVVESLSSKCEALSSNPITTKKKKKKKKKKMKGFLFNSSEIQCVIKYFIMNTLLQLFYFCTFVED